MTRALRAGCVIVGLAWAQSAVADPSLKDLAARTEVRAIETLTLTDQQFLTGDKNGKAVAIAGETAANATRKAVKDFVRTVFKLE